MKLQKENPRTFFNFIFVTIKTKRKEYLKIKDGTFTKANDQKLELTSINGFK